MNPLPVRYFLITSVLIGTVAFADAQQNPPIPGPTLTPVPTKGGSGAPLNPAVPGAAPVVTIPPATPQTAAPVPATPVTATPATHTVEAGDNPWSIAKKYGIKLEDLLKANEIKDPKNLKIGDVLKLPDGVVLKGAPAEDTAKAASAPAPAAPAAPPAGADWELYTIQKGDNPWKIAKSLKVDHQKIVKLNEGIDFTKLSIGQQIKVPKKP